MISEGSTKYFQQGVELPNEGMCSLILHENKILFVNNRRFSNICYEIVDGNLKKHSTLVKSRGVTPSGVTTSYGTFFFGGYRSWLKDISP